MATPLKNDVSGRDEENLTLIDSLLADQRSLTAVAQFARRHESHALPAHERVYRDLIPLSSPKPGQQFGFEVNLDKCSGCKACVTACHNLNGLDDHETWRSVGSLFGGTTVAPLQLTVTTACHHCIDPACLNGCPVLAYEKDSVTGIVSHIADRCIGCQYCVLKCPYEVPQFSKNRGIVRKCDMCSSRLAVGEAPACVQACPSEAIRIVIVDKQQIAATTTTETQVVPGAPNSNYTLPTTNYLTARELPLNIHSADFAETKAEPSHPSLVFMLVLTQLSTGMFCVGSLLAIFAEKSFPTFKTAQNLAALFFGLAGLAASVFHLGQPTRAWRALANWRKSWLSREIGSFSLFAGVAVLSAMASVLKWETSASLILGISASVLGLASVFCSAMIYIDTQREVWRWRVTTTKFFGTTLLLGLSGSLVIASLTGNDLPRFLVGATMAAAALKLIFEGKTFLRFGNLPSAFEEKSARLLRGELKSITISRLACGLIGGVILPAVILCGTNSVPLLSISAFALCLAGELLERHLFFKASVAPKMPGGVPT